jgi:hypothetical protein
VFDSAEVESSILLPLKRFPLLNGSVEPPG